MSQRNVRGAALRCLLTIVLSLPFLSCVQKGEQNVWDDSVIGKATLSGRVTDTYGTPLSGVTVSCMGTDSKRELRASGLTDEDGRFEIRDVPSNARYIRFALEGYASCSYTLEASRFKYEDEIVLNAALLFSKAVITGTVTDASDGNPMQGVDVTNGIATSRTDENGVYSLEKLTIKSYELTFSIPGGSTYTRSVSAADFVDGVATVPDLRLGGEDVWPSRKWQELADAAPWYGNEFRGSTGFTGHNHYSAGYMSSWPFVGMFRYEAEGCALLTNSAFGAIGSPDFNAYTYGRKFIFEGNRYMNVMVRTHGANSEETAVHFGVEVLDISAGATSAVKVGEASHFGSEYATYTFDLGRFVGHEVVIAYGIYFPNGPENRHLPCRRIAFSSEPMSTDTEAVLPGTKIAGMENWAFATVENLTSFTVNKETVFTGKNFGHNMAKGEGDNAVNGVGRTHNPGGQQGYSGFAGTNHIIMNWSLQYDRADVEPVNQEGFTIKTNSSSGPRYDSPDTYIASKFHIGPANSHIHFLLRNFSSTIPTVFRVTAITSDGTAVSLSPVSNTALDASEVKDGKGCWQLTHNKGDGNPEDYADFEYDLSQFNGKDVTIALSVHKGRSSKEEKLCIYSIELK